MVDATFPAPLDTLVTVPLVSRSVKRGIISKADHSLISWLIWENVLKVKALIALTMTKVIRWIIAAGQPKQSNVEIELITGLSLIKARQNAYKIGQKA